MERHAILNRPTVVEPLVIIGVDLGQAQDYTAITVCSPPPGSRPRYPIGWVERIPLGVPYPLQVSHLVAMTNKAYQPVAQPAPIGASGLIGNLSGRQVFPRIVLVLDYTGVGRPIVDMIYEAQQIGRIPQAIQIVPVTITGGATVNWNEYGVHIPKRDLASVVQRVLQEERLEVPEALEFSEVLLAELQGFRVKIGATGRETYGAGEDWRSAPHDDLVMSLAITLWYAEARPEVSIQ